MICRFPGLELWMGEWKKTFGAEEKYVYLDLPCKFSIKVSAARGLTSCASEEDRTW